MRSAEGGVLSHVCLPVRAEFDPDWPGLDICFATSVGFHSRRFPSVAILVATRTPANGSLPPVPTDADEPWLASAAAVMRAVASGRHLHEDYLRIHVHAAVRGALIARGHEVAVTAAAGYAFDAWLRLDAFDARRSDYLTQEGVDAVLGAPRMPYPTLGTDELCELLEAVALTAERLLPTGRYTLA